MNKAIIAAAAVAIVAAGCSHKTLKDTADRNEKAYATPVVGTTTFMPKATAFRMSGPYADRVAVTVNPATGELSYFPAPGDITDESLPIYLGDGWWLNRQGLGAGSVFTSWTMKEYAALKQTPSAAEIKAHIIPGAAVTDFKVTSVPLTKAMSELQTIRTEVSR